MALRTFSSPPHPHPLFSLIHSRHRILECSGNVSNLFSRVVAKNNFPVGMCTRDVACACVADLERRLRLTDRLLSIPDAHFSKSIFAARFTSVRKWVAAVRSTPEIGTRWFEKGRGPCRVCGGRGYSTSLSLSLSPLVQCLPFVFSLSKRCMH